MWGIQKLLAEQLPIFARCGIPNKINVPPKFILEVFVLRNPLKSYKWNPHTSWNIFKDLSLESSNIQTQNCAPIQCTAWPRNAKIVLENQRGSWALGIYLFFEIQKLRVFKKPKSVFFLFTCVPWLFSNCLMFLWSSKIEILKNKSVDIFQIPRYFSQHAGVWMQSFYFPLTMCPHFASYEIMIFKMCVFRGGDVILLSSSKSSLMNTIFSGYWCLLKFCRFYDFLLFFLQCLSRVDEHSSDSYIGRDDFSLRFLFRKSLQFSSGSNSLFCGLTIEEKRTKPTRESVKGRQNLY